MDTEIENIVNENFRGLDNVIEDKDIVHFYKELIKTCLDEHSKSLTKELQEAREDVRIFKGESEDYKALNEDKKLQIEQLQKEIAELKKDKEYYESGFKISQIDLGQQDVKISHLQSSLQSEKEKNKRLREGIEQMSGRLGIIKEWLNPDPFTDLEAAINGIEHAEKHLTTLLNNKEIGNPIQPQNPFDNAYEERKGE